MARKSRTRLTVPEQLRRTRELDALRLQRRLTPAEQEEADWLANLAYMRVWRAEQRVTEYRIEQSLLAVAAA